MRIKKDLLASFALIIVAAFLLIAAKINNEGVKPAQNNSGKCCKNTPKTNSLSPWNFITQGILHVSV